MASTSSAGLSRRPAVSTNRNRMPSRLISSSIKSRVVPGRADTMARSSRSSWLSSVDLPALGRPAITVVTPFLMTLPSSNERSRPATTPCTSARSRLNPLRSANSTSSSPKSSSSSSSAANRISCSRRARSSLEKPPRSWFSATWCARAESAAMRSATASAWARSMAPLRKARLVNSPVSARRAPWRRSRASTCRTT